MDAKRAGNSFASAIIAAVLDRKSTRLNFSHRDLPSFPTRRSSDLDLKFGVLRVLEFKRFAYGCEKSREFICFCHNRCGFRSEEHTSELQSPRSTLFPYTTLFRS